MNTFRFFQTAVVMISLFVLICTQAMAQKRAALVGSGKVLTKVIEAKDFDKLNLEDFNGKIWVEVGKPFSVEVKIDDNLAELLEVKEVDTQEHELSMGIKDNRDNKRWIEETNIQIRISMPEISVFKHRGNADVIINNVMGRYFRINHRGNGNIKANGKIDELDIVKSGNGDVNAESLSAKSVKVKSLGNGNVIVNCENEVNAMKSGNGDIFNKAKGGKISLLSEKEEEGESKKSENIGSSTSVEKVKLYLKNPTAKRMDLRVKYYPQGSYGITVKPLSIFTEKLPIGSEIYDGSELIAKATKENDGKIITLK
ncbi:MAG: GIN domain-containing protein [Bacteroidia bacterium]